jgi:pSer/pThr/pTyr-binding forkhead associated (FHA) protein
VPKRLIIGRADPGRGFHPDIDLTPYGAMAAGVSRKHALLSIHSDTFQIKDLGSVNGTFVNRERLPSRQTTTLCDDVELRFGTLRLRIEFTA